MANPVDALIRQQVEAAGWRAGTDIENQVARSLIRNGRVAGAAEQQVRVLGYRLDFAWPAIRVALEVDGPTHFAPSNAARDAVRDAALRAEGWLIFRVDGESGTDVLVDQTVNACRVIDLILTYGR